MKGVAAMTKMKFAMITITALFAIALTLPTDLLAKKWDIPADSVELTAADIDRPYQIKEIISFKIRGKLAEKAMEEAQGRLREAAARAGCDAVIFVDNFTERDPTELFTNGILVQSLDSAEAAKRVKNYDSVEKVAEKVKKKEIVLSEKDINYPYKIRMLADVLAEEGSAKSMTNIDGQLSDLARKKRCHAVIYIKYDRSSGTQVNGAKGILVKFDRKWLKTAEDK